MAQEPAGKGGKRPLRIGKYEVIAHIATGGMGAVYKALDTDLHRVVALKVLSPELAAKPNMVERFKREGSRAARLRHENIVAIYDRGEFNGNHFLAFEFVDGSDLHDHIVRQGRLKVAEARQIMIQATRALDHAHRSNVIHRDIKPSNFLITKNEAGALQVKLADLGLARVVNDDEFRITKADSTIGTVDYMPPEQAQDSAAADIRSDIYSLGCTFYHMLGGKCPFPTGTLVERILKHRDAEPVDVRTLNPAVPPQVVRILHKMMAKKPGDRYQTPQELLAALENPDNFPESGDEAEPALRPLDLPAKDKPSRQLSQPEPTAPRREPPGTDESRRRDKTVEVPRPYKIVPEQNKRYRDQPAEKPRTKRKKKGTPEWWPWAAIGAGAAVLALVLLALLTLGRRHVADDDQTKVDTPRVVTDDGPRNDGQPQLPKTDPRVTKMGPEEPLLPRFYRLAQPLDREALRREFLGTFQTASAPPADATVIKVRRLAGPKEFHSVGEAIAKSQGPLVIEIHDQGPIFETPWVAVRDRSLWIRAGAGYRPLLAWETATGKEKRPPPLLAISGGNLCLEGVDVVAKWPAGHGEEPGCLFALRNANFQARQCTFTVAGKNTHGLILVRLEGAALKPMAALGNGQAAPAPADAAPARVHFRQCYARGSDLVILDGKGVSVDALLEGSLLVGGDEPMFRFANKEEDDLRLRLVRSTLVCSQNMLRWNRLTGRPGSPHIEVLAWDALLSRASANAPQGDMFVLGDGADLVNVKWRPVNSLYAGWKRLLVSADKSISTGAFDFWRAIWSIREGDHELAESWPGQLPAEPETLAAHVFSTFDTPALFAATGGSGPLGCELGRLPPEPPLPLQRTFERYPLPIVALPDSDGPPSLPRPDSDFYCGERLDLTQVDLGKHLRTVLQSAKPASRVVLYLSGKGKRYTSPIKVKGIANLVLFFEPANDKDEPLILVPQPLTVEEREALIDVEDGNLEIIRGRFLLDNKRASAVPTHVIRMRGGDLVLSRCYLQGTLDKASPGYQGLVRFDGADNATDSLPAVLFNDSVLVSSRSLLDLHGSARLRVRNCAALAVEDGLVFTPGTSVTPKVFVQLEHNTLAVRLSLLAIHSQGDLAAQADGIVAQAQHNYFLNPFPDEPRQARLLRIPGAALAQGGLLWQGKDNAFDTVHLQGYFAGGIDELGKQSFKEWQRLWGTQGEQNPTLLDPVKMSKAFTIDAPSWQFLGLPPQVRVGSGPPPFGADLTKLGLVTKKSK